VKETAPNGDAGAEKRRSARLLYAVPIVVTGTDALGQTFRETTATVTVSCTGCKYQSTHYVPKNSALSIEIKRTTYPKSSRLLQARVVWVQRPSNYRDRFHIAVEFDVPGNVWDIASPPENWFAHPEDVELEIPVTEPVDFELLNRAPEPAPYSASFTSSVENIERPDSRVVRSGSQPHMTAVTTIVAEMPRATGSGGKFAITTPLKEVPAGLPAREITVQSVVKETLTREFETFRAQIETQVREAIAEAVKTSLEQNTRLAIEKIVEQSNASVSAVTERAHEAVREIAGKFDEKIKMGMEAALVINSESTAKPRAPRKNSKRKAKNEMAQEVQS
jgi:hypothetical protein